MNVSDLEIILGQSVRIVGSRLGISDAEFYSVDELRKSIREKNHQVSECLESFVNSYWRWFDFHRWIEAHGKQGRLDEQEFSRLGELIQSRNKTRNQLLDLLSSTG